MNPNRIRNFLLSISLLILDTAAIPWLVNHQNSDFDFWLFVGCLISWIFLVTLTIYTFLELFFMNTRSGIKGWRLNGVYLLIVAILYITLVLSHKDQLSPTTLAQLFLTSTIGAASLLAYYLIVVVPSEHVPRAKRAIGVLISFLLGWLFIFGFISTTGKEFPVGNEIILASITFLFAMGFFASVVSFFVFLFRLIFEK